MRRPIKLKLKVILMLLTIQNSARGNCTLAKISEWWAKTSNRIAWGTKGRYEDGFRQLTLHCIKKYVSRLSNWFYIYNPIAKERRLEVQAASGTSGETNTWKRWTHK